MELTARLLMVGLVILNGSFGMLLALLAGIPAPVVIAGAAAVESFLVVRIMSDPWPKV